MFREVVNFYNITYQFIIFPSKTSKEAVQEIGIRVGVAVAGGVGAWKVYVGYRGTGSLIQEMFANLLIMPRLLAGLLVIANT